MLFKQTVHFPLQVSLKRLVTQCVWIMDTAGNTKICKLLRWLATGFLPQGLDSFTEQSTWNLWWTKWHWDRLLSVFYFFNIIPPNLNTNMSFICHSHYIILSTESTVKHNTKMKGKQKFVMRCCLTGPIIVLHRKFLQCLIKKQTETKSWLRMLGKI